MKQRLGHVTNSSSSSFIIGKCDDKSYTVESVYQLILSIYKELVDKKRDLKIYIDHHPEYPAYYDNSGFHINVKRNPEKYREIRSEIIRNFKLDPIDNCSFNDEWLSCKTYKEYEKFWMKKFRESEDCRVFAPFTIVDLENENEVFWPHGSVARHICKELHDTSRKSELFEWYANDYEDEIPDDTSNVCKYLGRVCIYSECGYIPQYVVNQLFGISEYACNHMG